MKKKIIWDRLLAQGICHNDEALLLVDVIDSHPFWIMSFKWTSVWDEKLECFEIKLFLILLDCMLYDFLILKVAGNFLSSFQSSFQLVLGLVLIFFVFSCGHKNNEVLGNRDAKSEHELPLTFAYS